jgi:uncharacterized membrane protein YfcA|tara:strand:+ start:4347 stop:5114 length:768 start_codon:yes stop_codon:yes gene_type:complete
MIPSTELLLLLFIIAATAGWVDTLAGGGGLITVPALLLTGMPPGMAIATNKLQGSMGTLVASIYFVRTKFVRLNQMKGMIVLTFIGSVLGSWLLLQIDASKLVQFLPFLLMAMGLYVLLSPSFNDEQKQQKISRLCFMFLVCPILGFYDGFFGPGTGSLMALAFVSVLGYGLSKGTAQAKILNLTSNVAALLYFIIFGEVAWLVGGVMAAGQLLGSSIGARMVMGKGAKLIKPVVVMVCFGMSINILLRHHPLAF